MNNLTIAEQLDQGIERLLVQRAFSAPLADQDLRELLGIAGELRILPSPDFKAQLKTQLLEQADARSKRAFIVQSDGSARVAETQAKINLDPEIEPGFLPSLFAAGYEGYPVHQRSLVTSFVLHATVLALCIGSGVWAARRQEFKPLVISRVTEIEPYSLPAAATQAHGGGGGGDQDTLRASKGSPPRLSDEQITQPAVVVRNNDPLLPAEPTVVGPPSLTFPQIGQLGDPLGAILTPPSNGTGSGGGIGDGRGGGVGLGIGHGVGPGQDGGYGGGVYVVGGGVSAPRAIYNPEPEFSDEAREAKYQGTVTLGVVIDRDGRPRNIRVVRSLGMGLDERALAAVREWRFQPATKDGQAVAVIVNIEVNFRLY